MKDKNSIQRKEAHSDSTLPIKDFFIQHLREVPIWIMSALFLLFGASKFYPFMPTPPVAPEAGRFMGALLSTGYVWQFVGLVEIVGGVLLLVRNTRLIGALLLLPVIAHIVPYLWILARTVPGIPMGLFLIAMEGWILWENRRKLSGLLGSASSAHREQEIEKLN